MFDSITATAVASATAPFVGFMLDLRQELTARLWAQYPWLMVAGVVVALLEWNRRRTRRR